MITSKTPKIDLHGEIVSMVEAILVPYINENIKLKNKFLIVIHGKSTNILTREVHRILKQNSSVKDFKLDNWNLGQTIVELNIKE